MRMEKKTTVLQKFICHFSIVFDDIWIDHRRLEKSHATNDSFLSNIYNLSGGKGHHRRAGKLNKAFSISLLKL